MLVFLPREQGVEIVNDLVTLLLSVAADLTHIFAECGGRPHPAHVLEVDLTLSKMFISDSSFPRTLSFDWLTEPFFSKRVSVNISGGMEGYPGSLVLGNAAVTLHNYPHIRDFLRGEKPG